MSTSCAAFLVLALLSGLAGAIAQAAEPISGTLSQPGYTVIALPESGPGKATTSSASGAFELNPPATEVTLHLRAPNGTYVGPIALEELGNPVLSAKRALSKVRKKQRRARKSLRKAKKQAKKSRRQLKRAKKRAKGAGGEKARKGLKKARKRLKRARQRLRKARKRLKQTKRKLRGAIAELKAARLRASGTDAILGVRAGAKLGSVAIDPAAGYATAKLTTQQWKQWADERRAATASNGAPIGAGNFGRVRVAQLGAGAPGDLDRDGVANALDIDDDGDLVVDNLDPSPLGASSSSAFARASQAGPQFASGDFIVSPLLEEGLFQAANANMPGLTNAQVEAALPMTGDLHISTSPVASSELDCGQLVYCTLGGTATVWDAVPPISPPSEWQHFPECCDPDGDGLGSLVPAPPESVAAAAGGYGIVRLRHGARSDQIRSGDVLIQRIQTTPGSPEEALVATIQYVFVTTPAPVSYSDGQGNSATIPYPVPWGGPGTAQDPFPVRAGPDGHVVVTLTGWRPQRKPIPPETGEWIDMGGLNYSAYFWRDPPVGPFGCDQSYYSSSDPNLVPTATRFGGGFRDLAPDRPASPANTYTFQVDLTACLAAKGISLEPGESGGFELEASSPQANAQDSAGVQISFERVP